MQGMCLLGIIRFRWMVWLGHLLRSAEGCLERRVVLRYTELVWRKVVREHGVILMDAPAHSNNDQLIGLDGATGTVEEREVARKQWKGWCTRRLSAADRDMKKRRQSLARAGAFWEFEGQHSRGDSCRPCGYWSQVADLQR